MSILGKIKQEVLENLVEKREEWEKPQELCREATIALFTALYNSDQELDVPDLLDNVGNIKLKQDFLEAYLKEALELLANNSVQANFMQLSKDKDEEGTLESLIEFTLWSNCERVGKDWRLNSHLCEELEVGHTTKPAKTDFKTHLVGKMEDLIDRSHFRYSEEEILAQLAHLVPVGCEEYYPRTIVPGGGPDAITDLHVLEEAYHENLHVCLVGDCGSGKTLSLKYLAFQLNVPYKSLSFNGACTIEDLLGTFIRAKRRDTNEIDWLWVDGWLAKMARYGGIFVAEEINAAPPEILFVLHDLLGHVSHKLDLTQAGGDIIEAHPSFFFCATMNPDYDGTNKLNAALADRFDIVLNYNYDTVLESNFIKDDNLRAFANALRERYPQDITTPPSPRMLQQFERNLTLFGLPAAREILINKFNTGERETVATIFDSKMGNDTRRSRK